MLEISEKLLAESAREYVIRVLKMNIINLGLEPGQNISEKEISEVLGVSRTPVREAFIKLSQEELLEIYPQKGTFISFIDLEVVEETKFLRATMEKAVARLACAGNIEEYIIEMKENLNMQEFSVGIKNYSKLLFLDNAFHRIIFKAVKKERIYSIIEAANSHFNRVRMLSLTASINLEKVLSQHRGIVTAICEKNSDKAEALMEEHITGVNMEVDLLKKQFPKHFKQIK